MVNFYWRFILNWAQILRPLLEILTKIKNRNISLNDETLAGFNKVKQALCNVTILSHVLTNSE